MTQPLIDYAWARPSYDAIKASGYVGVIRYLCSVDAGKNCSQAEAQAILAAGLGLALVFENGSEDARGGDAAGAAMAAAIHQLAPWFPSSLPVYVAVDYDAPTSDWPAIAACLNRVAWNTGRPGAMYGKATLGEQMLHDGHISYLWQSAAWSGSYTSPSANLYQRLAHTLPTITGSAPTDYDEDAICNLNCGLWVPPNWVGQAAPAPAPAPAPVNPTPPWYRRYGPWHWRSGQ